MPLSKVPFSGISNSVNFRNIVINGDMQIAQRGTSSAGLGTGTNNVYLIDRFKFIFAGAPTGRFTMSQSTDVPSGYGFSSSLKLDCTTAQVSPASGDAFYLATEFEGQNLQYLKKGTANAVSLTASFWVKSTKTGNYVIDLYDGNNTRIIGNTYTVNSANTWEKKTITFAGDTSGALNNDNLSSLRIWFVLTAGSSFTGTDNTSWGAYSAGKFAYNQAVNIADSTSNDFLITGVQLEAGTSASDFEFLPYDVSLGRCQRYFEKFKKEDGETVICISQGVGSTEVFGRLHFITEKRVVPSGTISAAGDFQALTGSAGAWSTSNNADVSSGDLKSARLTLRGLSGMTTGGCHEIRINGANGYVFLNSEL